MAAMADVLIPAGAVLLGGVITGVFTIYGQNLTHRSTHKREREARRDAFLVKRYEIERDTLIALQEAIREHNVAWGLVAVRERLNDDPVELIANLGAKVSTATTLVARVLDNDARSAVYEYLSTTQAMLTPSTSQEFAATSDAHARAQEAVGEAIRRDPLEDD